ncbi:ribonuclease E/G [Alphaproteobacteria bacterium]|nr:ribonuclease E/G [Alphaproteobacteria bacterium]
MTRKMLIDASQPEETRVVVMQNNRIEDFDCDFEAKKQLKGNIYLAKITRVEPSLQAAFVDYGGGRHGFLAFNEIHPDYYKIPIADREKLIEEETVAAQNGDDPEEGGGVETVGGDDLEDEEKRRRKMRRSYKIQEVIKRSQIILVQIVKEERGNKGAALTTYLSLPGRYCVLMPNTARGGGISRKITNQKDRKRLKSILDGVGISSGTTVIVRTAGSERTKAEINRDYNYLVRLWDTIREETLQSIAPSLIYEEANLIKRAIRDLYSKEIDEVFVDGDDGYRVAKDMMKTLMPSHAKKVQPYKNGGRPLFHEHQVEGQLDSINSPDVQLRSGGYIVLHQTEALVAIDVNSGKATRERHIEETAIRTNLEAAEEVARQLRLRDLAGLIVIDFIDMEENRNNHAVERRLKEVLRADRARIQVGRISHFGLLEMSRQRLRPSITEISSEVCQHCFGTGLVRSTEWAALYALRAIEEEAIKGKETAITATVHRETALYILNHKRSALAGIETRYKITVTINEGDDLGGQTCMFESADGEKRIPSARPTNGRSDVGGNVDNNKRRRPRRRRRGRGEETQLATAENAVAENKEGAAEPRDSNQEDPQEDKEAQPKKRRRGRRGGRRRGRKPSTESGEIEVTAESGETSVTTEPSKTTTTYKSRETHDPNANSAKKAPSDKKTDAIGTGQQDNLKQSEPPKPKRRRRRSVPKKETDNTDNTSPEAAAVSRAKSAEAQSSMVPVEKVDTSTAPPQEDSDAEGKRTGWWNKVIG